MRTSLSLMLLATLLCAAILPVACRPVLKSANASHTASKALDEWRRRVQLFENGADFGPGDPQLPNNVPWNCSVLTMDASDLSTQFLVEDTGVPYLGFSPISRELRFESRRPENFNWQFRYSEVAGAMIGGLVLGEQLPNDGVVNNADGIPYVLDPQGLVSAAHIIHLRLAKDGSLVAQHSTFHNLRQDIGGRPVLVKDLLPNAQLHLDIWKMTLCRPY